ncbi:MAG: hypothetical protein IT350_06355 [Deltaproteobacteria bacterium]|nr:hypothetical protein [Deltaproteobacteria bacterium]
MIRARALSALISLLLVVGLAACATGDDDDSAAASADDDGADGDSTDDDSTDDDGVNIDPDDDTDDDAGDDDADDDDIDTSPWPYFPPEDWGPFRVGVRTEYWVDESRHEIWGNMDRTLPVEIWYPAADAGGVPNAMPDMLGPLPTWAPGLLDSIYQEKLDELWNTTTYAFRDAPVADESRRFPVILFSHGLTAIRFQNYTLCEYLASHGFVVIAPDHYGNAIFVNIPDAMVVFFNPVTTVSAYWDRPLDVDFVYDEVEQLAREDDWFLARRLDLTAFGVTGHSYGALTSLLAGPGRDYIKAIAPLNPVWLGFFPTSYPKPVLMLQGTLDGLAGGMFDSNVTSRALFDSLEVPRRIHIEMLEAGHYSATDACLLLPPSFVSPITGCSGEMIDTDLANAITARYLTAFFRASLQDDDRYVPTLLANEYPEDIELVSVWQ